jgi:solute carrier family 25 folate transporter 32
MPSPVVEPSSSPSSAAAASHCSTSSPSQHQNEQHKKSIDPMSSFLAGIAGGASSTILLYPLDLVKVRMQVDENNLRHNALSKRPSAAIHNINTNPRTICNTVRGVIKHEGYKGLYRGLTPALIGSAASWGGFFIIYEELKMQLLQRKKRQIVLLQQQTSEVLSNSQTSKSDDAQYEISKDMHVDEEIDINTNIINNNDQQPQSKDLITLGPTEHFAASCLAGACMVALTNPIWLIKTRLQLQNSKLHQQLSSSSQQPSTISSSALSATAATRQQLPKQQVKPPYRGLLHAAYTIVKEEGILALYKGSVPALMLVSHGGIQFVAYEFLKGHFANVTNNANKKKWKKGDRRGGGGGSNGPPTIGERLRDSCGYLIIGAASKFIASTITYPVQVIKARLQQRSQVVEFSEATGEIIVTKREYAGVTDCVTRIWRNEGIVGFFKGCVTNAIRVAPSAAITFVTYEFVLDVLTEEH